MYSRPNVIGNENVKVEIFTRKGERKIVYPIRPGQFRIEIYTTGV